MLPQQHAPQLHAHDAHIQMGRRQDFQVHGQRVTIEPFGLHIVAARRVDAAAVAQCRAKQIVRTVIHRFVDAHIAREGRIRLVVSLGA